MKFLEKLDEPIIQILLAAALLSMFVDLFNPPARIAKETFNGAGRLQVPWPPYRQAPIPA